MSVQQVATVNPLLQEPSRISTNYLYVPTQRLIATAIFAAIWAYKFYYFTTGFPGYFPTWCFLDIAFFLLLYYCRIPWLQYPLWKIIFLIILSCTINSFLIHPRWVCYLKFTRLNF